ncbi:S-adenosyl-L-methionine-dependent methyltransferase [Fusarium flagelliforme]|uniref:S-adenosyl-L-methionine-dependent methyltransferase n=1 Tax=Fusarium flagelliforme TaxID=2675880 RepID=UPI001E8E18C1|nr:S-adenosyl-L-methionine-dependent methyltransferase [Fusarium flagelliforme]KAH7182306.1 S-adenosyl-L-methionine-dependent methyltransferase [Fusarium flagelliforme]
MADEPVGTPALTLQPAPTPAWEVLQNLQQAQENDDQEDDDAGNDAMSIGHTGSDLDSALGSDLADSTYSLGSSILEYRILHGRTYHSDIGTAQYWASNDEQASDSLDIAHHFTLLLLEDKLHLAHLRPDLQKVLDIGTGTGIWAIDFANEHPHVEVVATEISPIQPSWVPSNLRLEIEDCNDEWTFNPDTFDFIHMRFMLGSITDWTATLREAFTVCAPGGWVESYEVSSTMESDDNSIPDGSAMQRWGQVFEEGGQRAGRSFAIIQEDVQKKSMEEAGFVNIHVKDLKAPVGGWHTEPRLKQVGQYMQAALERDYEGYLLFLACELLGWTEDQVRVLCTQLRHEIRSRQHHPYFRQRIVYGQKPEF